MELTDSGLVGPSLKEIVRRDGPITNLIFLQRFRGGGDEWRGELDVSLTATRIIIESLQKCFERATNPSIVIVCSNASHLIAEEQPVAYHVAKAGLRQMARYYAAILGSSRIRVNCVTPGTVLKDESRDFYLRNRVLMRLYEHVTPLARMGTSQDLANVVGFLCSDSASFVTGQDIAVDGGLSLLWQESLARKAAVLANPRLSKSMLR
jgi:NAD(P)-dependent dehydrogenase (short-subunit alcohol dehydrogenase family)